MIKLTGLSKREVEEISKQIADAFYDYKYNDKDKCLRYEHLGMKIDRIRNCGEKFHMYDMIRE